MTYYGAKELAASFRTVRANTIKIALEIDEKDYKFQAAPESRSISQTLVHIAMSYTFTIQLHKIEKRSNLDGFDFFGFLGPMMAEEQKPRNKAQVIALLEQNGEEFATWVESLTEDFLAETVTFPPGGQPPSKSRFEMIMGVKEHEMHHRGQLMLMERMLGVVPHLTRQMIAMRAERESAAAKG